MTVDDGLMSAYNRLMAVDSRLAPVGSRLVLI